MQNDSEQVTPLTDWAFFEMVEQHVGQQIRGHRLAAKMSQAELAARVTARGYTIQQSTVAKVELGTRPIRVAELYVFASALEVPWIRFLLDYAAGAQDDDYQALKLKARELNERRAELEEQTLSSMREHAEQYGRVFVELMTVEDEIRKLAAGDGEA
ncbi:helix-turn-helix domain-containing protein [Clavibacter michiganensis]|nr:helix-turn-helix transcriptional regulator [Clavibacter michiganensis]